MKRTFGSALLLSLLISMSGAIPSNAADNSKDFSGSDEFHLVACSTATELDCVESFGFIDKSGKYVDAKSTATPLKESIDQNENKVHQRFTDWSATVDGETKIATLDVPLQSPKYVIFKNPNGAVHYGASLRPGVYSADLLNTHVRFKIRTSYLIPQNVQLVAEESDFSQTKIAGGNLWMFEGKGTPVSTYTDYSAPEKKNFSAPADIDTSTLHFIIHHGDLDLSRGYWPAVCGNKGYTVQAFNSNSAGSPSWNPSTKSLDFAIQSPHSKANGSANLGFFKLWTTDEFVDCKWPGNTLTSAAKIEVRIVSEDGVSQVSTSQVSHKDGKIFVSATGFHYSAPTIKLVPVPDGSQAKPIVKPIVKPVIKTITCIKGKTSKKVSGAAPVCPKGFKLKR